MGSTRDPTIGAPSVEEGVQRSRPRTEPRPIYGGGNSSDRNTRTEFFDRA